MSLFRDLIEAFSPVTAYAEEPVEEVEEVEAEAEEPAAAAPADEDDEEEEDEEDEDEDEEEEGGDQLDALRKECQASKDCHHSLHHYQECVERVTKEMEEEGYAEKHYKEDCIEEFFHLQHCVNECVAPKLFYKLK